MYIVFDLDPPKPWHAHSLYTDEDEPILMLITYGAGRVLHIPLGHFSDEREPHGTSLACVGSQTVLTRGMECVATGEVTIGGPDAFPSPDRSPVVAPDRVAW